VAAAVHHLFRAYYASPQHIVSQSTDPDWTSTVHHKHCSSSAISCGSWSLSPSTPHEVLLTDLCDQDQSTVLPGNLPDLHTNVYMWDERRLT